MDEIKCPHRVEDGEGYQCRIVSQITNLPIERCTTNDSACSACLASGQRPDAPNRPVASMAVGALVQLNITPPLWIRSILMDPEVVATVDNTPCIYRGPKIREQECKPCQAGSLKPAMVPVYRCPKHEECTLRNTGTFPRIQGCVTCELRESEYPKLQVIEYPPEILEVIRQLKR